MQPTVADSRVGAVRSDQLSEVERSMEVPMMINGMRIVIIKLLTFGNEKRRADESDESRGE